MTDIPETPEEGVRQGVVEFANDMLVSTDLMRDLIGEVETYRVDEAVYLRHTLELVIKQAKEAIAALDLHLLDVMEGPIQHAGWVYRKGYKEKVPRFDHDEITKRVVAAAEEIVTSADGDDPAHWQEPAYYHGVGDGAAQAVAIMRDIYLSDSTKAKMQQLDRYGIPRKANADGSVYTLTKGDPIIDVSPVMSQVQE